MMRTFTVGCLVIVACATDAKNDAAKRFLSAATTDKHVDLPDFDMSKLTDAEMNTTCGSAFEAARGAAWECMKVAQTSVNNGTVPVTDYYSQLCLCRDVFDKKMASCPVSSELIKARVHKAEISFNDYCTVGDTMSWIANHKALVIGLSVFAFAGFCLCILACCCCISKSKAQAGKRFCLFCFL